MYPTEQYRPNLFTQLVLHVRQCAETEVTKAETRSRIHESEISLRFLGIIFRVLRLEVSVYNVYSFKRFLLGGGGGGV
jgi:hypothetical protein